MTTDDKPSAFNWLHRMWTRDVGREGYDKAAWLAFETELLREIAPARLPVEPPDCGCEAAHGNALAGQFCPRCGSAVRVVGFQSCECGREQIEQLAPAERGASREGGET